MKSQKTKKAKRPSLRPKNRYKEVPGFSDMVKAQSNKRYRKSKGKDFELSGNIVLRALDFFEDFAEELPVRNELTGHIEIMPVVRLTNAAKLLNISYQSLWRWTSETKQMPMPVLHEQQSGREYAVYHVEEVRMIIRIIGDHFNRFKYYRSSHEATKKQLITELDALRAINYQTGELPNGRETNRKKAQRKIRPRKRGKRRNHHD